MFEYLGNIIDKEFIITDYIKNKKKGFASETDRCRYVELYERPKKKPIFMYDVYKKIEGTIQYEDIDIIHDYFYNSILSTALHKALHKRKQKYPKVIASVVSRNIGWFKEVRKLEPYPSARYSYLRWTNIILEAISCKQADGIMVNSEDIAQDLIKYCKISPSRIRVIPNPIDTDLFQPKNVKKEQLGLNPDENILLYVGNVFRLKGIYDLFDALSKVLAQEPNTRLIIVGSIHKEEQQYLHNYIKNLGISDNIYFIEHMSQDELISYYSASDIFVFPSLSEGSPRAVLEAIACGCPVVATNIAGIRSLDNCNEYISFVNIKSPSDLSEQILKLIHNTDLREEISKKGIIHVKTEFSEQRIAAQMLGFYEDISR